MISSAFERLQIVAKWLLSYLRSDWRPEHYPIRIRKQSDLPLEVAWFAQVLNWPGPVGLGASRGEAREALYARLREIAAHRAQHGERMPRPGEYVPIQFAATDRVGAVPGLLDDFIENVLGFNKGDPVFVSDLTRLGDFGDDDRVAELADRIQRRYQVTIANADEATVADILEQIDAASRQSQCVVNATSGPLLPPGALGGDAFAARVMELIRERGELRELFYEPDAFRIVTRDESAMMLNLYNGYQAYLSVDQEQRANAIARLALAWRLPEDLDDIGYETAETDLYPAIRARSYFELYELELSLEGRESLGIPCSELASYLSLSLVYDEPHAIKFVSDEQLEDWGVTFYEAYEAAMRNLGERPISYIENNGLYEICVNDSHDAARMLLVGALQNLEVEGDLICMVPSRDCLLLTGAESAAGLSRMAERGREAISSRAISGISFRLVEDRWEPWLPDRGHPSYRALHNLRCESIGQDYAEQEALLEKLHERTGEDIYVGSYSGVDAKDRSWSYALWAENIVTLLPRAEYLVFVHADGENIMFVPWDAAVAIAGDLMHDAGLYPVRYRVDEFPSPEQLERLRAAAIEP